MVDKPQDEFHGEVDAIKVVHDALSALAPDVRSRVARYVIDALDIRLGESEPEKGREARIPERREKSDVDVHPPRVSDIRTVTEEKQPRSATEMAAVVAYYLSELAPRSERKETIETSDLEKYFRQANFRLPGAIQYTLGNAASAGYFDSAGRGKYRLNAVGYNLVAHSMPMDGGASEPRKQRGTRKASKSTKKSTPRKRQRKAAR
jgi:hypothetical protein